MATATKRRTRRATKPNGQAPAAKHAALLETLCLAVAVPPDGLLKAIEAQALLRIGHDLFYRLIRTGQLRVIRVGKQGLRIVKRDLEKFMADHAQNGWAEKS